MKLSSRLFTFLIAVGFLLSGCDLANNGGHPSNLVVDVTAVAKALGRDTHMQKQLEDAHAVLNSQLLQITTDLTEQLEKQTADESDPQRLEQLGNEIDLKIARSQQLARGKAESYRVALINEFIGEVREHAASIGKSRNASVVTLLTPGTLWYDPDADITDEVIAALRAKDNAISGNKVLSGTAPDTDKPATAGDRPQVD